MLQPKQRNLLFLSFRTPQISPHVFDSWLLISNLHAKYPLKVIYNYQTPQFKNRRDFETWQSDFDP